MKVAMIRVLLSAALFAPTADASAVRESAPLFPKLRHKLEFAGIVHKSTGGNTTAVATAPVAPVAPAKVDLSDENDDTTTADATPAPVTDDGVTMTLPDVSSMMGTSSDTLKSINSQASILEARIAQTQTENEAKMARQKAVYEDKLKQQEQLNKAVVAGNKQIQEDIKSLQSTNSDFKKHAKELQDDNHLMRQEFKAVQAKLVVAAEFITQSLKETDDHSAKEIAQISQTAHKGHAFLGDHREQKSDDDDRDDGDDDSSDDNDDNDDAEDSGAVSFLSMRSKVKRTGAKLDLDLGDMVDVEAQLYGMGPSDSMPAGTSNPRDILAALSSGVNSLGQQEQVGETQLKSIFLVKFKAGTKRHQALLAQQKTLKAERATLESVQAKLKAAEAHLTATREKLQERLRGLGLFVQHLGHLALAPVEKVPGIMKALPKEVVVQKAHAATPQE